MINEIPQEVTDYVGREIAKAIKRWHHEITTKEKFSPFEIGEEMHDLGEDVGQIFTKGEIPMPPNPNAKLPDPIILKPAPHEIAALVREAMEATRMHLGEYAWQIIEPDIVDLVATGKLRFLDFHGDKLYLIAADEAKRWGGK